MPVVEPIVERPLSRRARFEAVRAALVALRGSAEPFRGSTWSEAVDSIAKALPTISHEGKEFRADAKDVKRALSRLKPDCKLRVKKPYDLVNQARSYELTFQ